MSKLIDLMAYIIKNYPHKFELSNARLTKLIYLADWKFVLKHNTQITNIQWKFDNFGPFVWDILNTANENPTIFTVVDTKNAFGNKKILIKINDDNYPTDITTNEKSIIDFVMKSTEKMNWDRFIQLVYSTFPILVSVKGSNLNLIEIAKEREKIRGEQTKI